MTNKAEHIRILTCWWQKLVETNRNKIGLLVKHLEVSH
jgi:hypothetical protein